MRTCARKVSQTASPANLGCCAQMEGPSVLRIRCHLRTTTPPRVNRTMAGLRDAVDCKPSPITHTPSLLYDLLEATQSQPSGLDGEKRYERLQELAELFVAIFLGLSAEQKARYIAVDL